MIKLSVDKIMELHAKMTSATGGDPNIRDRGLLESAVELPFATFGGEELYPSVKQKGARLGYSLIANHAFMDGNKRIGIYSVLVFLAVNGINILASNAEVAQIALDLASGQAHYDDLLAWIENHEKK